MAALTIERKTPKLGQDVLPSFPTNLAMGVADNVKCYAGGMVGLATSGANAGYVAPMSASTGLVCLGIAEKTIDNTVSGHTAGGLLIVPRQGVFLMANSTGADAIASANVGMDCYAADDNVVALSSAGGTRSRAGVVVAVDSGTPGQSQPTGVWVLLGITGSSAAYGDPLPAFLDLVHQARNTVSSIAAYTKTAGVILANSNGALGAQDGITNAVGDIVLFPKGVTNIGASDVGPWQITSIGGASAKFGLVRPADWMTGGQLLSGTEVNVAEGTLFASTKWFVSSTGAMTIDTTSIDMYPEAVTQQIVLVAGTVTVTNVPILSATRTGYAFARTTANTSSATTGGYHPVGAITPGPLGTVSMVFDATVAAGTLNNADISTGNLTIINR